MNGVVHEMGAELMKDIVCEMEMESMNDVIHDVETESMNAQCKGREALNQQLHAVNKSKNA